jgi:hypothetical protein
MLLSYTNISFVIDIFDYTEMERKQIIFGVKHNGKRKQLASQIYNQNLNTKSKNGLVFGELVKLNDEIIVDTLPESDSEREKIDSMWLEWYNENYDDNFDVDLDNIAVEKKTTNTTKFIEVTDKIYGIEKQLENQSNIYSDDYVSLMKWEIKKLEKDLKILKAKELLYGRKLTRIQCEFYILPNLECSFLDFNDEKFKIDPRILYKK